MVCVVVSVIVVGLPVMVTVAVPATRTEEPERARVLVSLVVSAVSAGLIGEVSHQSGQRSGRQSR
jgi:hypothetical protein